VSLLTRLVTFVVEVAVGLLIGSAMLGLCVGVVRAVGYPIGRTAFDVVAVLSVTTGVSVMVLRSGGSLRGRLPPPGRLE